MGVDVSSVPTPSRYHSTTPMGSMSLMEMMLRGVTSTPLRVLVQEPPPSFTKQKGEIGMAIPSGWLSESLLAKEEKALEGLSGTVHHLE